MHRIALQKLLIKLGIYNIARNLFYRLNKNQSKSKDFYAQILKENDLCFDVGANIGQKTDIFLKLGATIIAIEPQKSCENFLKSKYNWNKKVTIVNKALDAKEGVNDIYICEVDALSSMSKTWMQSSIKSKRNEGFSWNKKTCISTTTLDRLIKQYGKPQFCKIDVEGFEYNVIKGLSQKIPYISLEITPESINNIKKSLKHLSNIGSMVTNHCSWDQNHFTFKEWLTHEELLTKISQFDDNTMTGDIYVHFT